MWSSCPHLFISSIAKSDLTALIKELPSEEFGHVLTYHPIEGSFRKMKLPVVNVPKVVSMMPKLLRLEVKEGAFEEMFKDAETCPESGYIKGQYDQLSGNTIKEDGYDLGRMIYYIGCSDPKYLDIMIGSAHISGAYTMRKVKKTREECTTNKWTGIQDCIKEDYFVDEKRTFDDEFVAGVKIVLNNLFAKYLISSL